MPRAAPDDPGDPGALAASAEALLGTADADVTALVLLARRADGPMRVRATVPLGSHRPG